jgi:outer membrane receptor protein involved in Fe transport
MKKNGHLAAALLTSASVMALASGAMAQQAPAQVEEVVVTGSRLVANGNDMPTPVTVVAPQELTTAAPNSIFDGLAYLPEFAGGRSPQGNPFTSAGNNNSHQLNLKNIGVTRTLVLFDGHRVAPSTQAGEVDVDALPTMLIQRVESVFGGASAVYGSDAVSGVVNFVVDKKFQGIKMKAQAGVSEYGDSKEQDFSIAGGMDVTSRGHLEGGFEWYNNDGVLGQQKLRRAWAQKVWTVQGNGSAANPFHLNQDTRISATSFYGYITTANATTNPLRDMVFGMNGVLRPFVHGAPSGSSGNESGGDGGYFDNASLQASAKRFNIFGRFDYDITDNVSAYVEMSYAKIHNIDIHQTNEYRTLTMSATNAFLAPQYQAQLAAAKITTFIFAKMSHQMPTLDSYAWNTSGMINAGLNGTIDGYKWQLDFSRNDNSQYVRGTYNLDLGRSFAALDAVQNASGQVVCYATTAAAGAAANAKYAGCVPLNLFGPSSESQDAINYVLTQTWYDALNSMNDVSGSVTGSPFDDWAGPVQFAVSGEYRYQRLKVDSNIDPTAHLDCTGLRYNCTGVNPLTISFVVGPAPSKDQTVVEGALETDVPLLRDVPFVQALDFSGAVRYTDYDTSGTVTTWKAGATWKVDDDLSFRATRSLDIRAPTLTELFAPLLIAPNGNTDFHVSASGNPPYSFATLINLDTISNPNLKPEKANTSLAGVVYRPSWLPDFSVSVDYYKVKIGNAIANVGGNSQNIQNICEASNGTSPYCALIIRPLPFSVHTLNNTATAFLTQPQNIAVTRTEGVDFEANYTTEVGPGHFSVRALMEYQPSFKTQSFPGAAITNAANAPGLPSFRGTWFFKYQVADWQFDVAEKFHGVTDWNSDRTVIYAMPSLPWAFYTNATVTYDWEPAQVFLSVENLFNKQPTPYGGSGGQQGIPGLFGGFVPGDDAIGRRYSVGVRLKF